MDGNKRTRCHDELTLSLSRRLRTIVSLANGASGALIVKLAPTGTTLWNLALEGTAIRVRATPGGSVLVAGAFPATLPGSPVRSFVGGSNVFLVEYPP